MSLSTFVQKLPDYPQSSVRSAARLQSCINYLRTRQLELSEQQLSEMAYFLQQLDLSNFNDEELMAVSELRLDLLVNTTIKQTTKPRGLHDNGSFWIYSRISPTLLPLGLLLYPYDKFRMGEIINRLASE